MSRFAQVDMHINQPRHDKLARRVVFIGHRKIHVALNLGDMSVDNQHVRHAVKIVCRVDDASAANHERLKIILKLPRLIHEFAPPFNVKSSNAIRIATPF